VAIVGTIVTLGVGLLCIAPLNIALLILSAVLLSHHLSRQQPAMR